MAALLTCVTLISALSGAQGGESFTLVKGSDCPSYVYKATPRTQVTLNATGSTLRSWVFRGSNLRVRGATIRATVPAGIALAGYGAQVNGTNIRFDKVTVTDSKKGIVGSGATNLTVADAKFWRVLEDGMIVSNTVGLTVVRSSFSETVGKPTSCLLPSGEIRRALPLRDCTALQGTWTDGYHADAIQMRDAVVNARIEGNTLGGSTQGITQMDTTGDRPLERVVVRSNMVATDGPHHITLGECVRCQIVGNTVVRQTGSTWKAVIIAGKAVACGNVVQDVKPTDITVKPCT